MLSVESSALSVPPLRRLFARHSTRLRPPQSSRAGQSAHGARQNTPETHFFWRNGCKASNRLVVSPSLKEPKSDGGSPKSDRASPPCPTKCAPNAQNGSAKTPFWVPAVSAGRWL